MRSVQASDDHPPGLVIVAQEGEPRLGVDGALDQREGRRLGGALRQVGHPQVVAGLGALGCGHLQPASVTADLGAVVVGHRHAGAEHQDVLVG